MTMHQVAELAGVSQATVSRVINGRGYVSDKVARSVARAIAEIGYTPRKHRASTAAKNLSEDSTGVIAIVFLDGSVEAHPSLAMAKLSGVESAAAKSGLTVAIARVTDDHPVPDVLRRSDLLGVLLWGLSVEERLLDDLVDVPVGWLSSYAESKQPVLSVGNEQAGQLAAEHFLAKNIRYPAFVCPKTRYRQFELRGNGFRSACFLADLPVRNLTNDADETPYFESLDHQAQQACIDGLIDQVVQARPRIDGIFLPDDQITFFVYGSLAARGLRPGIDLAIVSCGNESTYLRVLRPRPTTIDLAPETTGRLAVEQLLRLARQPEVCDRTSVLILPKLIPGEVASE